MAEQIVIREIVRDTTGHNDGNLREVQSHSIFDEGPHIHTGDTPSKRTFVAVRTGTAVALEAAAEACCDPAEIDEQLIVETTVERVELTTGRTRVEVATPEDEPNQAYVSVTAPPGGPLDDLLAEDTVIIGFVRV